MENPRWFSVEIRLVCIWEHCVTLKDLKDHAKDGPLADLMVIKRGRLSVSRVKYEESQFIALLLEEKNCPKKKRKDM